MYRTIDNHVLNKNEINLVCSSLISRRYLSKGLIEISLPRDAMNEELNKTIEEVPFDREANGFHYLRRDGMLLRQDLTELNLDSPRDAEEMLPLVPDGMAVVCVTYATDLSTQIGITGKIKVGESPSKAMRRECLEETSLSIEEIMFVTNPYENVSTHLALAEVHPFVKQTFRTTSDRRNNRVALLPYGNFQTIDSWLLHDNIHEDGIIAVTVIKKSYLV